MDRAVIFVLVVVAGFIVLAVMWSHRAYLTPVFVNGGVVARQIDAEIGDMRAAQHPGASVGAATCSFILDLTAGKIGRCTIPVSGTELSVRVAAIPTGAPGRRVSAEPGAAVMLSTTDAVVVLPDVERRAADDLRTTYGEEFAVRCDGPQVRVLTDGQSVHCGVEAADVQRTNVEVKASSVEGDVVVSSIAHIATRRERVFGRELAERTTGGAVLPGRVLESYVRGSAAAEGHGEIARRGLLGAVHCPATVVLRWPAHASCTVRVGGRAHGYDVVFAEGAGVHVVANETILVLPAVREIATRLFERPSHTQGRPLRAVVDCGKDLVAFVEPGLSMPCTVTLDGRKRDFRIDVTSPSGGFNIVGGG